MAQEGGGKSSSIPASFFEMDDFDTHWDEDDAPAPVAMREPSAAPANASSEVHASSMPTAVPPPREHPGGAPEPPPTSALAGLELDLALDESESGLFEKAAPVQEGPTSEAGLPLLRPQSDAPARADSRSAPTVPVRIGAVEPKIDVLGSVPPEAAATVRPGNRRRPAPLVSEPAEFDLDIGGQHQQADRATPAIGPDDPSLTEARDRYATGDYSGALVVAEKILQMDAGNALAQRYAANCRQVLQEMYLARLGPLNQSPAVVVESDRLRWLSLDHRAGFLLSSIDGTLTIEELLDISGMPRFDALRILAELFDQNVIALRRER